MSTARTTPAQKPRGRTRSRTFPFFSVAVGIIILRYSFYRIYHTSLLSLRQFCLRTPCKTRSQCEPIPTLNFGDELGLTTLYSAPTASQPQVTKVESPQVRPLLEGRIMTAS